MSGEEEAGGQAQAAEENQTGEPSGDPVLLWGWRWLVE